MPTDWRIDFDNRHRFGIPTLPIRKGGLMPSVVSLPARAGSMKWSDEDVRQTIELLQSLDTGQAVRLTDDPDESDNTARRRVELMKEQISGMLSGSAIRSGYKLRGHVLTDGDPTVEEKESKKTPGHTYKVTSYPQNWGALSLVPESAPDDPAPDTEPEPATEPAAPAPATAATGTQRRRS